MSVDLIMDTANNILSDIRGGIVLYNYIIVNIAWIFLITEIFKIILLRNNKKKVKQSVFNIYGIMFSMFILNSVTLVESICYNANGLNSNKFIFLVSLLYCFLGVLLYLAFPYILNIIKHPYIEKLYTKIHSFFNTRFEIIRDEVKKNKKEEFVEEE